MADSAHNIRRGCVSCRGPSLIYITMSVALRAYAGISSSRLITGIRRALCNAQRTLLWGTVILYQIPMVMALPLADGSINTAMESYELARTSYKTMVVMGVIMMALAIISTTIAIAQFRASRRDGQLRNLSGVEADEVVDVIAGAIADFRREFVLRRYNRNR
ncbi:hypothetical protein F4680DRAFT_441345 [Xylaria scruposa]|nr:hypothetical protein F4680DRAFT_441345 [Xylaria scruposa]